MFALQDIATKSVIGTSLVFLEFSFSSIASLLTEFPKIEFTVFLKSLNIGHLIKIMIQNIHNLKIIIA